MTLEEMHLALPDIPRFYTALAEWLACLIYILRTKKRMGGWKLAAMSVIVLSVQSAFLILTDAVEGIWWILCMSIAVLIMYLYIFSCCQINRRDVGYYCVRAFILAELMASLEWEIECFFYYDMGWVSFWNSIFWLTLIYGMVCFICYLMEQWFSKADEKMEIDRKELISYIIMGMSIFWLSNLGYMSIKTPFTATIDREIFNIRTMIDLGGISILYAYHAQRINLHMRYELESIQKILHNQYVQYQRSQEAIEMINYKYHDLKHYIIALKAERNEQKRDDYLEQMEEELQNYEFQCKTGNEVLDTLLSSKNLYCIKHRICMTCVVDGTLFGFMDTLDICSIFGNALDNAIECEEKLPEEKRMIHVIALSQKNLLIIRFENYYEEELEFQQDLPVTTKQEKQFHGFGLKSVCYTVKKYGGEVDISAQGQCFRLKILIPMDCE